MEQYETGKLVKSKVGHDVGSIYVIIRSDDDYVYLCDGRIRTLDRPKKKKKKHVQIINHIYEINDADDVAIKRIISLYKKEA